MFLKEKHEFTRNLKLMKTASVCLIFILQKSFALLSNTIKSTFRKVCLLSVLNVMRQKVVQKVFKKGDFNVQSYHKKLYASIKTKVATYINDI